MCGMVVHFCVSKFSANGFAMLPGGRIEIFEKIFLVQKCPKMAPHWRRANAMPH
jgi:hypothetical protein